MNTAVKNTAIFVLALIVVAAVLCCGFLIGRHFALKSPYTRVNVQMDTLYVRDTITREKPVYLTKRVIERVPVTVEVRDTLVRTDTVWLEREQVEWRDEYCSVWASGIMPAVDSVQHYITTKEITKTVTRTKRARICVGVQAGVGVQYGAVRKSVDVGPYVGVGISYNLFSW